MTSAGEKTALYSIGPLAVFGQPSDVDDDVRGLVQLLPGVGGEKVAHAGSDAAVHDGGDAALPGQLVQLERVLGEKGDVDDGLAGFEDGLERFEPHEAGDGADDHVLPLDDPLHGLDVRQVLLDGRDPFDLFQPGQRLGVDVDDGDLEILVLGQVEGHRAAHQA